MTSPHWNPYDTPESAEYRKQQIQEYSTYVAVEPLMVGNALGFGAGDPVPASTVEREGNPWLEQGRVVKRDSKAGKDARRAAGQPVDDDEAAPAAKSAKSVTVAKSGSDS